MKLAADQGMKMKSRNAPSFFFFPKKSPRCGGTVTSVHLSQVRSHLLWKTEALDEEG